MHKECLPYVDRSHFVRFASTRIRLARPAQCASAAEATSGFADRQMEVCRTGSRQFHRQPVSSRSDLAY